MWNVRGWSRDGRCVKRARLPVRVVNVVFGELSAAGSIAQRIADVAARRISQ
jgi:hypothetical protein